MEGEFDVFGDYRDQRMMERERMMHMQYRRDQLRGQDFQKLKRPVVRQDSSQIDATER